MASDQKSNPAICPESTIDSANRRSFIKKAALVTAAAGVGGTILNAGRLLPESSAKSSGICFHHSPITIEPTCSCKYNPGCYALVAYLSNARSGSDSVAITGDVETCCLCTVSYAPPGGPTGIFGQALTGTGVAGQSCTGTGVIGIAASQRAVPLVAQGAPCQLNPLQEWRNSSGVVSAVTPTGQLALGNISTQGFELRVCAPTQCGIQLRGPKTGVGAGFVFETFCPSGGNGQGWQILDTGSRAAQGANKLNVRNLNLSKDVLTICGPTSMVGINTTAPKTTLDFNGSLSGKANFQSGSYTIGATDFIVVEKNPGTTLTLPLASSAPGMVLLLKNTSTGSVTVQPSGSDKIEGQPNYVLAKQYDSLILVANGNTPGNWLVFGNAT